MSTPRRALGHSRAREQGWQLVGEGSDPQKRLC